MSEGDKNRRMMSRLRDAASETTLAVTGARIVTAAVLFNYPWDRAQPSRCMRQAPFLGGRAAAGMLVMMPLAVGEVIAMAQFMRQSLQEGWPRMGGRRRTGPPVSSLPGTETCSLVARQGLGSHGPRSPTFRRRPDMANCNFRLPSPSLS